MPKTIIVCGYGTGISDAVANKFAAGGFQLALVARNAEKLERARAAFEARGIKAAAFPTDLADPNAAKGLAQRVQAQLGPVAAIHWNAYSTEAGDSLAADAAAFRTAYEVAVTSLALTVQGALADLKAAKGAVLVTNGFLGLFDAQADASAVEWNSMGLAIANAAKHKLVAMLALKLRGQVTVGEVVIQGLVKGTAWDTGNATIDPAAVAAMFWDICASGESKSLIAS
jgi:NADP-dependent 3-hydroxy acid dehydrogenase YdfG